jgi:hypothetical protein
LTLLLLNPRRLRVRWFSIKYTLPGAIRSRRTSIFPDEGIGDEFLVDHYLPEDDGPGNEDAGALEDAGLLDITGLLEDIDEDMGTLVDELEDITSSNAGTGSQQRRV